VALGHIHKPFTRDEWIYNPGSPETCSSAEAAWKERGYYLVEIDTERSEGPKHVATLHANVRRPFERIFIKTDLYESPEGIYKHAHDLMSRRARDLGPSRLQEATRPVVDLHLQGLLTFDRSALSLTHLEAMAKDLLNAIHLLIRNDTHGADFVVAPGMTMNRQGLERYVLTDLFSRDARFAPRSRKWARLALDIKSLSLDGAAPEAILDELEHRIGQIDLAADDDEPEVSQEAPENVGEDLGTDEGDDEAEDGELQAYLAETESGIGNYADLNG